MISKFEAMGCLDNRLHSDRLSTRRNAAETVQEEMDTVAGSSMHGVVQSHINWHSILCCLVGTWAYPLKLSVRSYPSVELSSEAIHWYHELLPGDLVERRAFAVWAFQKMAEDDDWLCNV